MLTITRRKTVWTSVSIGIYEVRTEALALTFPSLLH